MWAEAPQLRTKNNNDGMNPAKLNIYLGNPKQKSHFSVPGGISLTILPEDADALHPFAGGFL